MSSPVNGTSRSGKAKWNNTYIHTYKNIPNERNGNTKEGFFLGSIIFYEQTEVEAVIVKVDK